MRIFILSLILLFSLPVIKVNAVDLKSDNDRVQNDSEKNKFFYLMGKNELVKEVTNQVLTNPSTPQSAKDSILAFQRRFFVFKYPSDGLLIYGFISYTPHPEHHPLEIFIRGGNRDFGLMSPANSFSIYQNDTVISSTLRGGISEGQDEFGGRDLADIKNLLEYITILESQLNIKLHPDYTYTFGHSRGALEMFLALEKYPELQSKINAIVSVSGMIDLNDTIAKRSDMKQMFIDDFGYNPGHNDNQWLALRNPTLAISKLKPSLPILIIQGNDDIRVGESQAENFVHALEQNGNSVTYWNIENGNHSFSNQPEIMEMISLWVQSQK